MVVEIDARGVADAPGRRGRGTAGDRTPAGGRSGLAFFTYRARTGRRRARAGSGSATTSGTTADGPRPRARRAAELVEAGCSCPSRSSTRTSCPGRPPASSSPTSPARAPATTSCAGARVRPRTGWPACSARPCTTPWTSTPRSRTRSLRAGAADARCGSSPIRDHAFHAPTEETRMTGDARPDQDRRAARSAPRPPCSAAASTPRAAGRRPTVDGRHADDRRGRLRRCPSPGTADVERRSTARTPRRSCTWRTVPAPVRGGLVKRFGRAADRAQGRRSPTWSRIEAARSRSEALGEVQEMIDICDLAVGSLPPARRAARCPRSGPGTG